DGTGSGGMFFSRGRSASLASYVGNNPQQRVFDVLEHEGFHQFAFMYIGRELPIWVNEGLAEYFSAGSIDEERGEFLLGSRPKQRVNTVQSAINSNNHISFETLVTMTGREWSERLRGGAAGIQYPQSWSMVHFLIHGDGGRYRDAFVKYLKMVARNQPSGRAFVEAFGARDLEGFEKRWREHVAGMARADATVTRERLKFLADGLVALSEKGRRPPRRLDHLARQLKQIDHESTIGEGDDQREIEADDPAIYEYPTPTGYDRFEIDYPERGQPPVLTAAKAKPALRAVFSQEGEDAPLTYVIETYEPAEDSDG
ncbi:MAG: DUF1570 domain-containing protein, partial [Phycisphaeraceae bacterium]|nr:DUF1570 domain-containing protein [Phycisphaeraceae bacterium]